MAFRSPSVGTSNNDTGRPQLHMLFSNVSKVCVYVCVCFYKWQGHGTCTTLTVFAEQRSRPLLFLFVTNLLPGLPSRTTSVGFACVSVNVAVAYTVYCSPTVANTTPVVLKQEQNNHQRLYAKSGSALIHIVLLYTEIWIYTTECVKNRLKRRLKQGHRRQKVLPDVILCDEIHLNVIMMSLFSSWLYICKSWEEKKDCICETFPVSLVYP